MLRTCPACGLSDDHPRHERGVVNLPAGQRPPAGLHLDCCAASGCELCQDTVTRCGGRTGQDLIDFLAAERAARTLED